MIKRYEIEEKEKWRDILSQIPFIKFKKNWSVKIIPPFGGAITRFLVRQDGTEFNISVYLDFYDSLGCVGKPYWEIYPYEDDVLRLLLSETDDLVCYIQKAIDIKLEDK